MALYSISNTRSGVVLGVYEGATESEALDAMARNAGYRDHAEAESVAPTLPGELLVEESGSYISQIPN